MASVKVYGPAMSTAVSRVLACLLEKEVNFQLISVDIAKRKQKSSEHLKLQPFGQVPAFQDESMTLFESRAIVRYICDKFAESGNKSLFGYGLIQRATIDQWLEAEAQSFNSPSSVLVYQLAFVPRMKVKQDLAAIKQNEGKLEKVLDVYEKRLEQSKFLGGDDFSLADLSHLPNTQYIMGTDRENLFTSRKNVKRWWDEISNRPSWRRVLEMRKSPPS